MTARAEPLLWIQLLSLGVMPLEMQLIRLLLGAADPGPVPALERIFAWVVAVLAPTLLFWRQPPDWGSLLILSRPLPQRTQEQRQLSSIQGTPVLKAALLIGAALLLPVFWKLDRSAILLRDWSPLTEASRIKALLIILPILTLLLWQWQQTIQSLWLLTRRNDIILSQPVLNDSELRGRIFFVGLPVLWLASLDWNDTLALPSSSTQLSSDVPTLLKPEKSPTYQQGNYLDSNILDADGLVGDATESHDEQADTAGNKEAGPKG